MERIKDGALSFGLNHHASSLDMTFLGMTVLDMVEKTSVMISDVVATYEGVLFSGTILSALTHITPFKPQQGCKVGSVLCTCYRWAN